MNFLLGRVVDNMLARRSEIEVLYEGIDISKNIMADLIGFSFTDNASGNADDVSITLKDDHRKWGNSWFPNKGDWISAKIITHNWDKDKEIKRLPCGDFMVDEPEYSGRPRVLTLKAISAPANSDFLVTTRHKTWKKISLRAIATDIAKRYGLSLFFESPYNPFYKSLEQTDQSDSAFLSEVCEGQGFGYKVTDKKIIIYDEFTYEKRKSIATFKENDSVVISYSFSSTYANAGFAGCRIKYFDSNLGKSIDLLFSLKDEIDPKKDKIFVIKQRFASKEEGIRAAQKKLRSLNKKEFTASLEIVGNTKMLAGSCIDLEDFGSAFDGKYFIEKATHNRSSRYVVNLDLRKVLHY